MLPRTYFPPCELDRFVHWSDRTGARYCFEPSRPSDLHYLGMKRCLWMNDFIDARELPHEKGTVVPVDSGADSALLGIRLSDISARPREFARDFLGGLPDPATTSYWTSTSCTRHTLSATESWITRSPSVAVNTARQREVEGLA